MRLTRVLGRIHNSNPAPESQIHNGNKAADDEVGVLTKKRNLSLAATG